VERSSGEHQGALHISKRGSAVSRQWLYFAVLRLVQWKSSSNPGPPWAGILVEKGPTPSDLL
jgi:hypothetical protein